MQISPAFTLTPDSIHCETLAFCENDLLFSRFIGPVWAAQTAEEAIAGTGVNIDMEQRRAFELANTLLREIDRIRS